MPKLPSIFYFRSSHFTDFLNTGGDIDDILEQASTTKQSTIHEPDVIYRVDPSYPHSGAALQTASPPVWSKTSAQTTYVLQDSGFDSDLIERRDTDNPLYETNSRKSNDIFKLSSQYNHRPTILNREDILLQDLYHKKGYVTSSNGSLHLPPEGSFSLSDIMHSVK